MTKATLHRWHAWVCAIVLLFGGALATNIHAASNDWYLATLNPAGEVDWLQSGEPIGAVPLGSAWKLFVYAYATDNNLPDKTYACHAGQAAQTDDEYCCSANENIGRDVALARSCGPYFKPQRLGISAADWQNYWRKTAPQSVWLQQLGNLTPNTQLSVKEILTAMNSVPQKSMMRSREALLQRLLQPAWGDVLADMGSGYRFKTYTWHHPRMQGAYFGGATGWLADGRSFWVGGTGGSHAVMSSHATQITQLLPPASTSIDDGCVNVNYFSRYPIDQVTIAGGAPATAGTLRGQYAVRFTNGNQIAVGSQGELSLLRQGKTWRIIGQLSTTEYIARVLDREADATKTQAARALAVAAHSYLQQNGHYHQACWQIDDDSRYQRVSPNRASEAARTVAAFTEDLTLTGSPIYYHQNQTSANTLNWQASVTAAEQGDNYISLLRRAYPQASWQMTDKAQQCQTLNAAQKYLNERLPQVQRQLADTAGFEFVDNLQICRLDYGNPYTDAYSHRIYLRDWRGAQDRLALWHEYLHLALRYHPDGRNEAIVEQLAQRIVGQTSPVVGTHTSNNSNNSNNLTKTNDSKKVVRRAQ